MIPRSVVALALTVLLLPAATTYDSSIGEWRADRERRLRAEDGWLSLTGLFWLEEGSNTMGSRPGSRVLLPGGSPANAGVLVRKGTTIRFEPAPRAEVRLNQKPVLSAIEVRTDRAEQPDILGIGQVRLLVIERGGKIGVRMKDPQSKARVGFRGLSWFPVNEEWNIRARFVPQPRKMLLDAQAGGKQEHESPGYVEWQFRGQTLRMTPVMDEGELFFIFRDATSGRSTYGAARFLYAPVARDGFVTLDFNKAYNPPCVFTPYATCPLPPPETRMKLAVEAGEKMYVGH